MFDETARRPEYVGCALLLSLLLVPGAALTAKQTVTLSVDMNRVQKLAERNGGVAPLVDVVENAMTVTRDGDEPLMLVMFTVLVRNGRAVRSHQSEPFDPAQHQGVTDFFMAKDDRHPVTIRFLRGARVNPEAIVVASEPVPANHGADGEATIPASNAISFMKREGVVRKRPGRTISNEAVYIVAVPADAELRGSAMSYPIILPLAP